MKYLRFILALCLCPLTSVPVAAEGTGRYAEPYRFIHIDRSLGLSYDAVKCMLQDSRGFIWIGTYKGLNRYDGVRVKNYDRSDMGVDSDLHQCPLGGFRRQYPCGDGQRDRHL